MNQTDDCRTPGHLSDSPDFCANVGLMALSAAWDQLQATVVPVSETVTLPLSQTLGMTVAQAIKAQANVPPFANSAMDGYALALATEAQESYELVGRALAGAPWTGTLKPGQAIRIMTGAAVPDGADTVEMQEKITVEDERIKLQRALRPGNNIRPAGDDFAAGDVLVAPGETIGVPHIGLLMSAGVMEITVLRPIKVAVFATGDELKSPGEALGPGQIFESNRAVLKALIRDLPVIVTDLGIIPDDPETLRHTLRVAGAEYDLILSSGGVSVGDSDYTRQILEELGTVHFWRLAIKPGKPLAFGRLGQAWFFGLPGNPVSAMATAHLVMMPALRQLAGQAWQLPPTLSAIAAEPFHKKPGRRDFQRAQLSYRDDGTAEVRPTGTQGSHQLSVLARSNAYAVLAAEQGDVAAGATVQVMPFPQSITGVAL